MAGPVVDGEIEFTNLDWRVSEGDLLAHFEFEAVELINDFAGPGAGLRRCWRATTCGPLGKALPRGRTTARSWRWAPAPASAWRAWPAASAATSPCATEGGHADFAPSDEVEVEVLRASMAEVRPRLHRAAAVRPGALRPLLRPRRPEGPVPAPLPDEVAVTREALVGDPLAAETLDRFGGILGRRGRRPGADLRRQGRGLCLRRHRAPDRRAAGRRQLPRAASRTRAGWPTMWPTIPTYLVAPLSGHRRRGAPARADGTALGPRPAVSPLLHPLTVGRCLPDQPLLPSSGGCAARDRVAAHPAVVSAVIVVPGSPPPAAWT